MKKTSDLKACLWQYSVTHESTLRFIIGSTVFLKSNPEILMIVFCNKDEKVGVKICDGDGFATIYYFYPQCLLQYKYAALLCYDRTFEICLN